MDIKIDLKDPKHCNGCPCLSFGEELGLGSCGKDYEINQLINNPIRPQRCIEENGD